MWRRANAFNLILITLISMISIIAVSLYRLTPSQMHPEAEEQADVYAKNAILQEATESSKDIWVNKNGRRFHYHLESPKTRIILKTNGDTNELVEEMVEMRLWMQDRFSSTPRLSQQVRFIQSPLSTFHFSSHKLTTERSFIALYTSPGEELSYYLRPELITLRGRADAFDIQIGKDGVNFSAKGFSAQINESGDENE